MGVSMNRELFSSVFWLAVGALFFFGSFRYSIFRSGIPGAGFFPFMGGILLIVLSLVVLISALAPSKKQPTAEESKEKFFSQKDSYKRILLALLALFVYWLALGYLGFLLTTFLFMLFLLRFIDPQRWITTLTVSFLTTISAYMLFNLWLKVRLPPGIWKI
jgi:putative tricarboxylic transport membrane protein